MTDYLTTKELAALLRIKPRKVYDMAAKGQIPCSRAMGKLLFPRAEVQAWVAAGGVEGGPWTQIAGVEEIPPRARPQVFLGSHDPLLEWALRQSQCGLATFFDGSLDGLDRFDAFEGVATGLHIHCGVAGDGTQANGDDDGAWNIPAVQGRFGLSPVVLVEFAWRDRGLIVAPDRLDRFQSVADLKGHLIVARQPEAGSQTLLEFLLTQAGLEDGQYVLTPPARTETDAAELVARNLAGAALGLKGVADQFKLGFRPVIRERFDLLIDRRAWFEPPMQAFLKFCDTDAFLDKAITMGGYDVGGLGRVHFNGGA